MKAVEGLIPNVDECFLSIFSPAPINPLSCLPTNMAHIVLSQVETTPSLSSRRTRKGK